MQGHTAGVNMAGGNEVFGKAIPMNSIGFFGLHIMTAGTYEGEMYEEKSDSISVLDEALFLPPNDKYRLPTFHFPLQ